MNDDTRRIVPPHVCVSELHTPATDNGRWVAGNNILQQLGQSWRRQFPRRRLVSTVYRVVEMTYACPMQGRYKVDIGIVDEHKAAL